MNVGVSQQEQKKNKKKHRLCLNIFRQIMSQHALGGLQWVNMWVSPSHPTVTTSLSLAVNTSPPARQPASPPLRQFTGRVWALTHSPVLRLRRRRTTICRSCRALLRLGVGCVSLCATLPPPGLIHNSCPRAQTQAKQTNTARANARREAALGESRRVVRLNVSDCVLRTL